MTMFVLDASARMNSFSPGQDTLLVIAQRAIASEFKSMNGRYAGLVAFGAPPLLPSRACDNVRDVLPLGPLDVQVAQKGVAAIQAPGEEPAPLIEAIRQGADALERSNAEPNSRLLLVTVVGGPDTCSGADDPSEQLQKIDTAFKMGAKLRKWDTEYKVLSMTVPMAFTEVQRRMWKAFTSSPFYDKASQIVLPARDPKTFSGIVSAAAGLSSPNYDERIQACQAMGQFIQIQEDMVGLAKIKRFRQQLGP